MRASHCHLDGARFANACAALGCTPAEMTWKAGIDAVSFGGTKNGCMGVEAVVLFDPARGRELALRRKRAGHLWSKHRYLAAQMLAYATDGLWLEMAQAANAAAARLAAGLRAVPGARILHEPAGNLIYAELPRAAHARALRRGRSITSIPATRRWRATLRRPSPAGWSATGPRPRPRSTP
jgi:threonine aldolase